MSPYFPTTRWTLVMQAASENPESRRRALADLLSANWYPLYAFLRQSGNTAEQAEDLIQGFFAYLLDKNLLAKVDQQRHGRFRNFLLTCLKNYTTNQWRSAQTIKRGGDTEVLSLDFSDANERYQLDPADGLTPQKVFERAWAVELIQRSLAMVAERWESSGKSKQFELLNGYLTGNTDSPREQTAEKLGVSRATLDVQIHRLRAAFRESLCELVAQTLDRDDLLEDEINMLFSAFHS